MALAATNKLGATMSNVRSFGSKRAVLTGHLYVASLLAGSSQRIIARLLSVRLI